MNDYSDLSIDELLDRRDDLEGMLFGFDDEDEIIIMDLLGKIDKELKKKGWVDKEDFKRLTLFTCGKQDRPEKW